jgi:uncharacterized protein (TIGR04255 family)
MSDFERPKFARPPVVETVYGAQFDVLHGFRNAHLGAFWCTLGPDWPDVSDAPLLPHQFERFGDDLSLAPVGFLKIAFKQDEDSRIQIRNRAGDRMVQLQNGRLLYNWIQVDGAPYPSADVVRAEFQAILARFGTFVADYKLGPLVPNQWEVTYVNHFLRGSVWNSPADWAALFEGRLVQPPAPLDPLELEGLGGTWRYVLPGRRGRLHVELVHGRTGPRAESPEALVMKLTARGPVREGDAPLDAGISLGHDAVVSSFRRLTSAAARDHWGEE